MEQISAEVIKIYDNIKVNETSNLTFDQINIRSFRIISNSCIGQNKDETKSLCLNDLKKIIIIIGSIKKILNEKITKFQKITIENKLIKLLIKLEIIIKKYNLNFNNILESFIESDNLYLEIINSNQLILPDHEFIYDVIERMKNKITTIFLETNENILISDIFDTFLNLIYLEKILKNYLSIVDVNINQKTYYDLTNKINEINLIINNFISMNQFIKKYINFNNETQTKIRINIRENLFNSLFKSLD